MKYYHEITKEERESLLNHTYGYLMENYKQPEWCSHYEALAGVMGCWSLIDYPDRINKEYCSSCPCFK